MRRAIVVCSTPSRRAAADTRPLRATARNTCSPSQFTGVSVHYCTTSVRRIPDTTGRRRGYAASRRKEMSEAQLFVATAFTEIYERVLVAPLFRPFAEQLVASVAPDGRDSIIDVACGTGIAARVARERLGPPARIVGVDV